MVAKRLESRPSRLSRSRQRSVSPIAWAANRKCCKRRTRCFLKSSRRSIGHLTAQIVFIGGNRQAIRVVDVGNGRVRSLVTGELGGGCTHHLTVCWRKSDALILATSRSTASSHQQGTFLPDPETKKITQLFSSEGKSGDSGHPVPSPDGKQIAAMLVQPNGLPPRTICLAGPGGAKSAPARSR